MSDQTVALVGDIGGTNARFALVRCGQLDPESVQVLQCGDYNNLDAAIVGYLRAMGVDAVAEACLAVASSALGPRVQMTNNHWCFDIDEVRQQFQWEAFKVINDFAAMALGVPHVSADNLVHVCGGPGDPHRPRLVMGPGTGLGVSALVPITSGWIPLTTEGGHVDFAPLDDIEVVIFRKLKARFGRVSVERLLCGEGLLNLYQAHAGIRGIPAPMDRPEQITTAAVNQTDTLAQQALEHFCGILGRVAGNAALTLGSMGGVYLCGGMLPRFLAFFLASSFREGFEGKGRMKPLMQATPVYVVTEPFTGLLGAAEALANPEV